MSRYLLAALLLSSCADHTDISGTYVGDGKVTYQPKNGARIDLTIPNDTVIVKMTRRDYQYIALDITVRGCVLRTDSGEKSWAVSAGTGRAGACSFDVPSVGPVIIAASGGLERRPPSSGAKPQEVHLSFYGENERLETFYYSIDARPMK